MEKMLELLKACKKTLEEYDARYDFLWKNGNFRYDDMNVRDAYERINELIYCMDHDIKREYRYISEDTMDEILKFCPYVFYSEKRGCYVYQTPNMKKPHKLVNGTYLVFYRKSNSWGIDYEKYLY